MFEPVATRPLVSVSAPLSVGLLFKVMPLALFTVRPASAVTLLGTLTPDDEPPKTSVDADVVERLPGVPAIVGPFSVSVFAPTENVPLVRVSVPLTVRLLFSVTPLALLIVSAASAVTVLGMFTPDDAPPNTSVDDEVVVSVPEVTTVDGPLRVSVFAPTANAPLVSVRPFVIALDAPRLTPLALAMTTPPLPPNVDGNSIVEVVCAALPAYCSVADAP